MESTAKPSRKDKSNNRRSMSSKTQGKEVTGEEADETSRDADSSRRDRKAKRRPGGRERSESDFFIEVVIDELKRENGELRAALEQRDKQVKQTAEKVSDRFMD